MDSMTPAAWLALLEKRLDAQSARVQRYRDYYDGRHKLVFATAKFREAFGSLFAALADNWMQTVVDVAVERLAVTGFRFGGQADDDAWRMWQDSNMDAGSAQLFTEASKCGMAYLLVAPGENGGEPRFTVEHPQQMIVATAAGDRTRRLAALKRWVDDSDGHAYATLYLPDALHKWRSAEKAGPGRRVQWRDRTDDAGGRNPLGVVPVVAVENKPDLLTGGRSDLEIAIPMQDAINKLGSDMLVSSEYNAYPQRWATGLEVPNGADGQPDVQALFKASQGHIWVSGDDKTQFGQLMASPLANYVEAIDMWIHHLAAQTRTPPHYMLAKLANISGDALKAAETGLVARVKGMHVDFADPLEEAMRLAFLAKGDRANAAQRSAETVWANPESRDAGVLADTLIKKRALGVPLEVLWEEAGYTPSQIDSMKRLAGLPDRPPPGATTATTSPGQTTADAVVPPVLNAP